MSTILNNSLPYTISIILAVCLTIGGMVAFRNGRQIQLTKFQEDTNKALKERLELLEKKIIDFERENAIQRHVMDTITSALKQRGLIVTIDGDLVTIADAVTGAISNTRKRTASTPVSKPLTPAPGTFNKKDLEQP